MVIAKPTLSDLRTRAESAIPNGTPAIQSFRCVAYAAGRANTDCCLELLQDLLEDLSGYLGHNVAGSDNDATRKCAEVASYIRCLRAEKAK